MAQKVLPTGKSKVAKTISNSIDIEIQDVEILSEDAENGGSIETWKSLELREKLKMRALLTYSTVVIWFLWTIGGLIDYLMTGNPFLLVTSPPIGGLLYLIFKFYFSNH